MRLTSLGYDQWSHILIVVEQFCLPIFSTYEIPPSASNLYSTIQLSNWAHGRSPASACERGRVVCRFQWLRIPIFLRLDYSYSVVFLPRLLIRLAPVLHPDYFKSYLEGYDSSVFSSSKTEGPQTYSSLLRSVKQAFTQLW